jgi:hypothetical protein
MNKKNKPIIKRLVKHGRSLALVIDKNLLKEAGLKQDAFFQFCIYPSGGLLIQSVDNINTESFEKCYRELSVELSSLMKKLSHK